VKLWRFEYRKCDESDSKHDQSDSSHGNDEISPTHILASSTGDSVGCAGESAEKTPGDEGSKQLGKGPKDREDSEEVGVGTG
jgi:hypothetical protein